MAEDDKKNPPQPGPEGRKSNDTDKALKRANTISEKQGKKQDLLTKLGEVANKLKETESKSSDAKHSQLEGFFDEIATTVQNTDGRKTSVLLDQLDKLTELEKSVDEEIKTAEKAINNDDVVRGLQDLVEDNKRQTSLLEADSTAALELQNQIRQLNSGFYSGEFFNDPEADARAEILKVSFESAQADLKAAIESGDMQAQDLAMRQLEEIKAGAESEENQREARKMNQLANDRLYQIADATEKTAENVGEAISGALAGAGILAGLVGFALLFLKPEAFQAIVEGIINQVSGVIDIISGIISGDFSLVMSGLGDSWQLMLGVALALLPKVIGILSKLVKGIKVFRIFMMGSFIPGMVGAFTSMMTAMTPILAAMAPVLLPILAIAAAFGLLMLGVRAIRDAMGFGSMFDVIKVAWAYVKDGMAMFANVFIDISNMIMGLVGKFAKFLGFEVEMPQLDRMATDNAEKAKEAARQNKVRLDEEKALEEEKEKQLTIEQDLVQEQAEIPEIDLTTVQPTLSADMMETTPDIDANAINNLSLDNALEKGNMSGGDSIVTQVTKQGNSQVTTTSITTIQTPLTRASNILGSVTAR